jgi:Fibronectin type III domain
MPSPRRLAIPVLTTLAVIATLFGTSPAQAAITGTLGVNVTGRYTAGHTGPLAEAVVTAENLDSGLLYPVAAYGDPATSAYYQALNLPFGRYRIRIERFGFATGYWPRQYSRDTAAAVTFGVAPGCNPADAATCDVHLLTSEIPQAVTLSGSVRGRDGLGRPGVPVTAVRAEEPTYRPSGTTDGTGAYSLQVPPGDYVLKAPNGNDQLGMTVPVIGATVRDLTLLDPPGQPTQVAAQGGNRQAAVSWQRPKDDGGADISSYTVTANPGAATCTTQVQSCTVPGLENGRSYSFAVTATNRIGTGPASTPTAAQLVSAAVPAAPSNVRVTAGDRALAVTWSASGDTGTAYTATATPGGRSCSTTALSCEITSLRNGRAYTVTVTATTPAGSSAPGTAPRPVRPLGVPGTPRAIRVAAAPAALRVAWRAPLDDGGRRITHFVATAWPGGRTCQTDGALTCTIRGLRATTSYSVTVRAANRSGTGAASPGSVPARPAAGPAAPSRVSGLRVSVRRSQVRIEWRESKRADAYWVRLLRPGKPAGSWSVVTKTTASFATYPGVQRVQVRAAGPGGFSSTAQRTFRSG